MKVEIEKKGDIAHHTNESNLVGITNLNINGRIINHYQFSFVDFDKCNKIAVFRTKSLNK